MTSQRVTLTLGNHDNVIQYKDEAHNRLMQMDIAGRLPLPFSPMQDIPIPGEIIL